MRIRTLGALHLKIYGALVGSNYFLLVLLVLSVSSPNVKAAKNPYDWAYIRLDYARKEKVAQFQRYCDQVHKYAVQAREDETLLKFFEVQREYYHLRREGNQAPRSFVERIREYRKAINVHYINNYLGFYDILMVDTAGNIFYTIRKESDFQKNLFKGDLADTTLANRLRNAPQKELFIDFQYYPCSDEPAAFFVEPVRKEGKHLGWFVLQCAINKVNSIFAGAEDLGETGESFLVNQDGYMLTASNFEGDPTILKKQLDDRNIVPKFKQKKGHRKVTDYRGFQALTSFDVVEFLGTKWLVVVKIDEAQVTTDHFLQHYKYYGDQIIQYLHETPVDANEKRLMAKEQELVRRVDMDEFVKASHNELLKTVGVSTCTAVVATYPGHFGYLAHISPQDRIYGGDGTNILGHAIERIKTYDIYKYEWRRVRFVVVARHQDSLLHIIDELVEEGFLLSQIDVLHGPDDHYANVDYDYSQDSINVQWVPEQTGTEVAVQHATDAQNLGEIVKQLITGVNDRPERRNIDSLSHVN
jgi:hypothetical protein